MFYPGFDSEPFQDGVYDRYDYFGRMCLFGIYDHDSHGPNLIMGVSVIEGTSRREIPEFSEKVTIASGPDRRLNDEDYRTMNGVYESWGRDTLDKVLRHPEFVSDICHVVRKAVSEMDYAMSGRRCRR